MQKNLYYRTVIKRYRFSRSLGALGNYIFTTMQRLIEVFIRKDFGERHFRFSRAIGLAILLYLVPNIEGLIRLYFGDPALPHVFSVYATWYIFIVVFLCMSYVHYRAQKRSPSVFDFSRYSYSYGVLQPWFLDNPVMKKIVPEKIDTRIRECFIEPAPFLVVGILLALLGQRLGYLLILSSLSYCAMYRMAYRGGDDFVMDIIDEMVLNAEMKKNFVDSPQEDPQDGSNIRARKPTTTEQRQRVMPSIIVDEDEILEAR